MGNSNSADTNFNPLEYVRPGINQHEVIGLRNVFESLDPEDGKIQVNDLKVLYKDSYDKNNIDSLIGQHQTLNFNQFFDIMSKTLLEKKKDFNLEVDSDQEITCILCPTSVDRNQNHQ